MIELHVNYQETSKGYAATCEEIPRFLVSHTGDWESFKNYVKESIYFYHQGEKERKEESILDDGYNINFKQMNHDN